jgi:hypothetical protein
MFIALDKLNNQGLQQAIVVVPERSIGGSFADEPLSQHGFYWDWQVAPQWNLCNAPGVDDRAWPKSKVDAVRQFLESAATRCWSAPMPPSASRWKSWASPPSTTA